MVRDAWQQLQTYPAGFSSLFPTDGWLVVSDDVEALDGTLASGWKRLWPWRTIDGEELAPAAISGLQAPLEGVFDHNQFLVLPRDFTIFEDDGNSTTTKEFTGYHQ